MTSQSVLSDINRLFRSELAGYYPDEEIRNFFFLSVEHLLNYSKIDFHLKAQESISEEIEEKLQIILRRLKSWEPIQYILGDTFFYGLPFAVDKRVLIPRPETEELVQWIIDAEDKQPKQLVDLGTGSGCIAVALALHLAGCEVSACDVSGDALAVAQQNAALNHAQVSFFMFDMLNEGRLPGKYHVIVSNPPYVISAEKKFMRRNVLDFEPGLALYVPDDDPLIFYRRIALLGRRHILDGGRLYLEINEKFSQEITRLLENAGFFGVEVKKDINGRPRMVKAIK
jgi:release factor glutamine methyltransferase